MLPLACLTGGVLTGVKSQPLTELGLPAAQSALRPALPHTVPAPAPRRHRRRRASSNPAAAAASPAAIGGQFRLLPWVLATASSCRLLLGTSDTPLALSATRTLHAAAAGLCDTRRRRRAALLLGYVLVGQVDHAWRENTYMCTRPTADASRRGLVQHSGK